jgi:hypothetical protein
MRRGSSNAISPTNFGWDSGWHGRNVKDLGSRIDNVHNERRSSGFDPRSSASISSDHMEPTFSSPPHQHKKRLEHKGGMKLKRSGSAPRRRRSSLGTTESWEALKRTQQQQSYHQPRARPQKQRPLSLSSTYHSSSSNNNNNNNSTTLNIDEIMSMKISKQKKNNNRPRRKRPATASKSRSSAGKRKNSNMPISVLGHREATEYPNGNSINTTYSNFVRMLSLFYDESDHVAIVQKACEDAKTLHEKLLRRDQQRDDLLHYTGTGL